MELEFIPLFTDSRGWVMATDKVLVEVAYAYATCCYPGQVKGWHKHRAHTDRVFCVSGRCLWACAIQDINEDEDTVYHIEPVVLDPKNPVLVTVPPYTWHAFAALDGKECVVINCPDKPYDPDDQEDSDEIPFDWKAECDKETGNIRTEERWLYRALHRLYRLWPW